MPIWPVEPHAGDGEGPHAASIRSLEAVVRRGSGAPFTLVGVKRIVLIPAPTSDGRHIILRAEVLGPGERLRRFVRRLRARR